MLTVTLVASLLACSAATAWNSDPWPAASQQRPAAVQANSDPWPAASQQRTAPGGQAYSGNPDDFWWNKPGNNAFDDAAARPQSAGSAARAPGGSYHSAGSPARQQQVAPARHQASGGRAPGGSYHSAGSPARQQQVAPARHQASGGRAPTRAIVSVSSSGSGAPRITGVRRVSSAAVGGSRGGAAAAAVSSQYIPPGAGSQARPQQPFRGSVASAGSGRLPSQHQSFAGSSGSGSASYASAGPGSHVSVSSGGRPAVSRPQPSRVSSGQYSAPRPSSGSRPGQFTGSTSHQSGSFAGSGPVSHVSASRPQPSRVSSGQYSAPRPSSGSRPGQFTGSTSQQSGSFAGSGPGQYAGSSSGTLGGSDGAQGPVVKSCGASLFCVDTASCDPYTGFLMDPSQGPIPQLDQPTVAFTRCYMNKSRSVGVCCQEPHVNDPWTDRTTNGR